MDYDHEVWVWDCGTITIKVKAGVRDRFIFRLDLASTSRLEPQESVLYYLLPIYISDFSFALRKRKISLYADRTAIYLSIVSSTLSNVEENSGSQWRRLVD